MQRSIDAPDQVWSDVNQASHWLGASVDEFRALANKNPELLPYVKIGKRHCWFWLDLVYFVHRRNRVIGTPAEPLAPEELD